MLSARLRFPGFCEAWCKSVQVTPALNLLGPVVSLKTSVAGAAGVAPGSRDIRHAVRRVLHHPAADWHQHQLVRTA